MWSQAATLTDAIVEGSLIRFRPIMMTTMAALMGTLPIALGFGAGAESRRPLGLAVVGGLLVSQLLIWTPSKRSLAHSNCFAGAGPAALRRQPARLGNS